MSELSATDLKIESLKKELSRLNGIYNQQLQSLGLTDDDLKKVDLTAALPLELRQTLEKNMAPKYMTQKSGDKNSQP